MTNTLEAADTGRTGGRMKRTMPPRLPDQSADVFAHPDEGELEVERRPVRHRAPTGDAEIAASPDTRERIFLAAERLFAERGFDGVSVRDIVQAAGVNLAAVSYHFGSKSELLLAVFRERTKAMNRERHALLRAAEARHAGNPPVAEIVRAMMAPPILWRDPASGKATASRFISRALLEVTPDLRKILESDVSHQRAFVAALAHALPELPHAEVCWTFHFTNALPHQCTDTNFKRLSAVSEGRCDPEDVAAVLDRAVRYAIGGIEAARAAGRTAKP
jgi:AcrR family transcriptional regulator